MGIDYTVDYSLLNYCITDLLMAYLIVIFTGFLRNERKEWSGVVGICFWEKDKKEK